MSAADELWKKLVFFVGDIRALHSFPWMTWSLHRHLIDYDELLQVLPRIRFGDVGIHRDWGYLTNLAIPGFMKHAWIHVQDGIESPKIVEAVSEGVIRRNPLYPLFSDFAAILSPNEVTEAERKGACKKAEQIVGRGYDVDFAFDIEYELQFFNGQDPRAAKADLKAGEKMIKRYDPAFTCTEVVSYAWWHRRESLGLKRRERRGKSIILADDFFNSGWRILWLSRSVTPQRARRYGLHAEGVDMIADFCRRR